MQLINQEKMTYYIESLDKIASIVMTIDEKLRMLEEIVKKWLTAHGIEPDFDQVMNHFIHRPKTEEVLGFPDFPDCQGKNRKYIDNMKQQDMINEYLTRNQMFFKDMIGAQCVLFNPAYGNLVGTYITPEMYEKMDKKTGIVDNDWILLPSVSCVGMAYEDYARIVIRKILSNYKDHLNEFIILLSIKARIQAPGSIASNVLIGLSKVMMNAEFFYKYEETDSSILDRLLTWKLQLYSDKEVLEPDHEKYSMLGKDKIKMLKFACGLCDKGPNYFNTKSKTNDVKDSSTLLLSNEYDVVGESLRSWVESSPLFAKAEYIVWAGKDENAEKIAEEMGATYCDNRVYLNQILKEASCMDRYSRIVVPYDVNKGTTRSKNFAGINRKKFIPHEIIYSNMMPVEQYVEWN